MAVPGGGEGLPRRPVHPGDVVVPGKRHAGGRAREPARQAGAPPVDNPMRVRQLRRDIARTKTILRQKAGA